MALAGTYARSLDDKQRLAIPKQLSDQFGEVELRSFCIAPGTQRSLSIYSPTGFERLARKISRQSSNRVEVQNYKRLFYARAEKVELDAQGRIRIPERLVKFAGLQRDVVLLGVHDHAEVWDSVLWETFLNQHGPGFDDMAAQAFE